MRARLFVIDEDRNEFIDAGELATDSWLFDRVKNECSSVDDEPQDMLIDLRTDDGDIFDTVVMSRQMRERALGILGGKL